MLLPLYVLCSKIAIKKNLVYSQVSRDFVRFPVFTVRILVENMLLCGVLSFSTSQHTTHCRSKTVKSRIFFVLMFVVSHILKIL